MLIRLQRVLSSVLAGWIGLCFIPIVHADETEQAFIDWLSGIQTFEAEFVQLSRSPTGEEQNRTAGVVRMRKPSDFWWEIRDPYSLFYVLDGEQVLEFDPDLEQVTYRPLAQLGDVPIVSILLDNEPTMLDRFTIESKENHFLLKPKLDTELFRSIAIYFDGISLDAIDVVDHNDDNVEFTFKSTRQNIALSDTAFQIDLPDGLEVIGVPGGSETDESL